MRDIASMSLGGSRGNAALGAALATSASLLPGRPRGDNAGCNELTRGLHLSLRWRGCPQSVVVKGCVATGAAVVWFVASAECALGCCNVVGFDRGERPLMVTGGFKTRRDAADVVSRGFADVVGLARTLALDPDLPSKWLGPDSVDPHFPRFDSPPEGGVTAWYTMRLTALANNTEDSFNPTLEEAVHDYETRDTERAARWIDEFGIANSISTERSARPVRQPEPPPKGG